MRNSRLGVRNRNNASTRTRTSTPARAFSAMRATISVPTSSPARISVERWIERRACRMRSIMARYASSPVESRSIPFPMRGGGAPDEVSIAASPASAAGKAAGWLAP